MLPLSLHVLFDFEDIRFLIISGSFRVLSYEESASHPLSLCKTECPKSERAGVSVGGEVIPRQRRQAQARVQSLARPVSLTKTQHKQHYLELHANYHPVPVRCRRLAEQHQRKREAERIQAGDDLRAGGEPEPGEVPTISFDFYLLIQKDQGRSLPVLVARDHKSCYTQSFIGPGKSTKEEEYSDRIVQT